MAEQGIVVDQLRKVFRSQKGQGEICALDGVTLAVAPGQFCSVIGPSGCGKSTLLRILGGLEKPSSGSVTLHGSQPRQAQGFKQIGFVFQRSGLLPWKTVSQNISLAVELNRKANRGGLHKVEELIRLVGLERFSEAYPYQLSGGMRQRVAIARALAIEPRVLLMDEPLGSLDEITRHSMRYELLRIWEREKTTVVFVTHSVSEAVALSDVVAVLSPLPGKLRGIVEIGLARPRSREAERSPEFLGYCDQLTDLLKMGSES